MVDVYTVCLAILSVIVLTAIILICIHYVARKSCFVKGGCELEEIEKDPIGGITREH